MKTVPCFFYFYNFYIFRIVADNIDHEINARVQTKDHGNRSLHWTHQFAVKGLATEPNLDEVMPKKHFEDLQLVDLLPDQSVQKNLVWQWAVLVSRIVTKYLPAFKPLQQDVIFHIPHKYSKAMEEKSDIVSSQCLITIDNMSSWNPSSPTGTCISYLKGESRGVGHSSLLVNLKRK